MNKRTIEILKKLSTGLVVLAMVFAFLIAGIRIFGVQVYGVLTGSMEPSYPTGSLIYVKRVDADDLRVNDVITFSLSSNVIVTHRIVEIVADESNPSVVSYRTKGDANNDADASLVSASNIIGRVIFSVPRLGYLANYIQEPPGIYVAIFVCGLMIAFVFYTDSLESKQKAAFQRGQRRGYAARGQGAPRGQAVQRRDDPRRRSASRQDAYARQRYDARQDAYARERRTYREDGYARRGEDYPSRQSAYRQTDYERQQAYSHRREYAQDREYPRTRERVRTREYDYDYDYAPERSRRSEHR